MLFGARTGATRPRQMFRDACPFIPVYYVLILGACSCKARNTRPNRPPIDRCICNDSLARAHASKNATERRLKEGPTLSWLFDRLHACRANPLHARSRVFRMVSDTPVLRFLPLPVEIFQLIDIPNSKGGGGGAGGIFGTNFGRIFRWWF